MRKSIAITLMMLFVVGSAQAVSVNWGGNGSAGKFLNTTGGTMTTGVGSETASIITYYILSGDYGNVTDQTSASTYAKATASGYTSTAASWSGRINSSSPVTDFTTAGITYYARVYATMSGTTYYMDIKNGGTTAYWTTTGSGDSSVFETLSYTAASYGGATGVSGEYNKWVAVPEPTSMALFGLGAAVLGLRRRFQKKI